MHAAKVTLATMALAVAGWAGSAPSASALSLGIGDSFTWAGNGNFPYLSAQVDITVDGISDGIFDLTVKVANLTDPLVNTNDGNRLSAFGVDTSPNTTSAEIDQGWLVATQTIGNSAGLEACFKESGNNNCNQGGGGIGAGNHLTFNVDLTTDDTSATTINFDRVWVRFQSVGEGTNTELSDNFNLAAVPLPAGAWLILSFMAGFGVLRRIKSRVAA